jgi:hypothetical protein
MEPPRRTRLRGSIEGSLKFSRFVLRSPKVTEVLRSSATG